MNDLINRQSAIDAMIRLQAEDIEMYGCKIPEGFDGDRAVMALKELPSAEPGQKTGKWKEVYAESGYYGNGWIEFTCENCEYQHGLESGEYEWHYGDDIPWKYCPICGAKMGRE